MNSINLQGALECCLAGRAVEKFRFKVKVKPAFGMRLPSLQNDKARPVSRRDLAALCERCVKRLALGDHLQDDIRVNTLVEVHDRVVLTRRLDRREGDLTLVDLAETSDRDRVSDRCWLH